MRAEHEAKKRRYEKKAAKTKKRDPAVDEQLALREEVMAVIGQHIDECVMLEKKRYGGGPGTSTTASSAPTDPTVTSLPDIDDPRFQQLIKTDREIDRLVEVLGENVRQLGQMARDIRDEAHAQGEILDQLDVEVSHADAKLQTLNRRLKTIVEKARPGSKFIIDFILIIVLLGLGGLIYTVIKARW